MNKFHLIADDSKSIEKSQYASAVIETNFHMEEEWRLRAENELHENIDIVQISLETLRKMLINMSKMTEISFQEKLNPSKCAVDRIFRTNVLKTAVREPKTQIAGLVVLSDMSGSTLRHAKFLTPHLMRRTVQVIQEAFPLRFGAFHILNQPFYFDAILTVLKPFLRDKIRRRLFN